MQAPFKKLYSHVTYKNKTLKMYQLFKNYFTSMNLNTNCNYSSFFNMSIDTEIKK